MRRRRRAEDHDALDLLLDAISNVFGGILFIALAVVILLQFTVPRPNEAEPDTPASPPASTLEAARMDQLLAALESDAGVSGSGLREEHAVLREALDDLLERSAGLAASQAEAESMAAERAEALISAQRRHEELLRSLAEAEQALEDASSRPTTRVRVGRFQPTGKAEVPLMVSAGRVVRVLRAASSEVNGEALRIDAASSTARPKPGVGIEILPGPAGERRLIELVASLDPGRQYLNVAVWPDGFDAARRLRDTAIALGFEFTLTPIRAGSGVPFNAASGVQ